MNDLNTKLAELKILQTKFDIWVDRLGQSDEIVQKIQSEIDSANRFILALMVEEQENNVKKGTIA